MDESDLQPEPHPQPPSQGATLRFETSPYQPDGGCPPAGAVLVLLVSLLAAVAIGWVASFIGQWLYLIILFPALLGGAVGAAGAWANRRGKVRNSFVAGVIGILAGCLAMLSVHLSDYQRFLSDLADNQPALRAQWDAAGLGFFKFMDLQAEHGVQIGRAGHGDKGMNLGYIGSFIYWGVELLIGAGITWGILLVSARAPFCTPCNSWKRKRLLGRLRIPSNQAVQILTNGEIVQLADHNLGDAAGPLLIQVAECPNCLQDAPVEVFISEVTKNAKGEEKVQDLACITYPGEALPVLNALAMPSVPAPATAPPEPSPPS
jgi:hypothetical protein